MKKNYNRPRFKKLTKKNPSVGRKGLHFRERLFCFHIVATINKLKQIDYGFKPSKNADFHFSSFPKI
jgi:hypothetical protein